MYKYLYILNDIENKIQNGDIKEGKKLPSIRSLVTQYVNYDKNHFKKMISKYLH